MPILFFNSRKFEVENSIPYDESTLAVLNVVELQIGMTPAQIL